MGVFTLILYCILGFSSFLILYFLRNKYKIGRLYNTIFSIVNLLIFACIFEALNIKEVNKYIFIVFIFQFIFDFIYTTYIIEEDFFNKRNCNTRYYFLLIIIGLLINNYFINKVNKVFLSGEQIKLIIWTLIFIFIYKFIQEEKIFERTYRTNKLLDEGNVLTMFTRLRRRYLEDIKVNNLQLELAIYSIMIFYNSKRSTLLRYLDNIIFKITGKKRKLGIMQIESSHFINDVESIEIVTQELKKMIGKKTSAGSIETALSKFMKEDNLEVLEIYNILKNFFKI